MADSKEASESSEEQLSDELKVKIAMGKIGCHFGVTCDACGQENMFGCRYRCSICDDYDLCCDCFEDRKESKTHKSNHPVKIIRSPDVYSKFRKLFNLGLSNIQEYLCSKGLHHDVSCSICDNRQKIKGLLFICDDCRGYRMCYNCYQERKISGEHKRDHPLIIRVTPKCYKLPNGTQISLKGKLGAGSFGEVHKCEVNGSTAAVKVCKTKSLSCMSGREIKSLENEIKIYQEFFCDYIVEIIGYGLGDNNHLCLVLEYLSSGNLEDRIRSEKYGKVSKRRRFIYGVNIVRGLFRMHRKGIIHKDLKPDNIFLTSHDTVKLGDLGIAYNPDYTSEEVEEIRQKHYYPTDNPNSCHPTFDIYAFGLLFNEIMTGNRDTRLTQDECKDSKTVPYFGPMISACISKNGRDRPTTQCVKEHLLEFGPYLDQEIQKNGTKYNEESLEKRNDIFDKAYNKFTSRVKFVNETDQEYQERPKQEEVDFEQLMLKFFLQQAAQMASTSSSCSSTETSSHYEIQTNSENSASASSQSKYGNEEKKACSLM